jgi:hypothetical protein
LSAPDEKRGLTFSGERSTGVLVVFELDHKLILLEPFKMSAKAFLVDHQLSWLMRHRGLPTC